MISIVEDIDTSPGVYILSGPVQTGKTTRILAWCNRSRTGSLTDDPSVDEVGPLELAGGGLEPAVSLLLASEGFASGASSRLLLVIREHLVDDALEYFGLSAEHVRHFPFA